MIENSSESHHHLIASAYSESEKGSVAMKNVLTTISKWDLIGFTRIFNLEKNRFLAALLPRASRSADGHFYPLVAAGIYLADPTAGGTFVKAAILAFAIELPLYKLIKGRTKRNRPYVAIDGIVHRMLPPDQFSFPSGHTAAAFLMATLVSAGFPALAPAAYAWALTVGLSRIYLGVHYPTDVIAGILLGTSAAALGLSVTSM